MSGVDGQAWQRSSLVKDVSWKGSKQRWWDEGDSASWHWCYSTHNSQHRDTGSLHIEWGSLNPGVFESISVTVSLPIPCLGWLLLGSRTPLGGNRDWELGEGTSWTVEAERAAISLAHTLFQIGQAPCLTIQHCDLDWLSVTISTRFWSACLASAW